MGTNLFIVDRVCLEASRKLFKVAVSMLGVIADKTARPIVEATASVTMHSRASLIILVALTPPYHLNVM
jgi:hypothetical protein